MGSRGSRPPGEKRGKGEPGSGLPAPLPDLERTLAYVFRDRDRLREAMTHRSLLNEIREEGRRDNERLEFLGDAVLGLMIAEWLMEEFPEEQEGELTRLRALLVREKTLAEVAGELDLGRYLFLGKGEEQMAGRRKRSILADAFEALLGAVYLDGGIEPARRIVRDRLGRFLREAKSRRRRVTDPKTQLQELLLSLFHTAPVYEVIGEEGPDHAKTFDVELRLKGRVLGRGRGRSKKEAEQDAADRFLKELEKNPFGFL